MTLTFVDSSALIAAARGDEEISRRALTILDDPQRRFVGNSLLKLEVLPKPRWNRRSAELEFYEAYFDVVEVWTDITEAFLDAALARASALGLGAVDAIHLQSAVDVGAEFVTAEKPTKPFFRERKISILSIR